MNTDDPKFTAYALGEKEDLTPAECAEIEALLANDPLASAEAVEMCALAGRLRAELPGEEASALLEDQRATILSATASQAPAAKVVRFPRRALWWSAVAACVVVSAVMALLYPALQAEKEAARRSLAHGSLSLGTDADGFVADNSMTAPRITLDPSFSTASPTLGAVPLPAEAPAEARVWTADSTTRTAGTISGRGGSGAALPSTLAPALAFTSPTPAQTVPTVSALTTMNPATTMPSASAKMPQDRLSAAMTTKSLTSDRYADNGFVKKGAGDLADLQARGLREEEAAGLKRETLLRQGNEPANTEAFDAIADNAFLTARDNPLSTFSIDVDTASYAIVRRFLSQNQRPPKGAVRIEEMLNYFTYDYPQPQGDAPFSATMEATACPWNPEHRLVRIGLKGREIAKDKRPASNLVFLIDVSGSMQPGNKLPLLKQSLGLLIDQLGAEDRVSMVVYAGSSGCVLDPTNDKAQMRAALGKLQAGGSTNGASGLLLAYQLAEKSFVKGGTNRVILATDGDWNVGVTNQSDLLDLIAQKAKSGVFLTVLGFGMDNLKDSMMVKLADRGNGNYAYLDTLLEAKKVLVEQLSGTLVTIAKDVKIQVEFNPAQVGAYRLIGYEKRMLAKEDFNDDKKDAGEIGAGHTVTALYEVVPAGRELLASNKRVAALKYQSEPAAPDAPALRESVIDERSDAAPAGAEIAKKLDDRPLMAAATPARKEKAKVAPASEHVAREMLTLKLRYKEPEGDTSKLLEFPLTDSGAGWERSSRDLRFAASVAGYGMLLRDSPHKGQATWSAVAEWAQEGLGADANGYRAEFLALIEKAKAVTR